MRSLWSIVLAIGVSAGSAAAQPTWQSIGPDGGAVGGIARDPEDPARLYAVANLALVYRSVDGGRHWEPIRDGNLVAVAAGGVVLVGTSSGLFRSADRGASWTRAGDQLPEYPVMGIAVAEDRPAIVYVALSPPAGGVGGSLFRSADAGTTWSDVSHSGPAAPVGVDPSGRLVVSGTHRSEDSGATWTDFGDNSVYGFFYSQSAIDRRTPATVVLSTPPYSIGIHMFGGALTRSLDGGQTFGPAPLPDSPVWPLSVSFSKTGDLYVGTSSGLFVSQDRGDHWSPAGDLPLPISRILPGPLPGQILVGTTTRAMWETFDSGATWSPRDAGFRATSIGAIAIDPRTPSNLWVGGGGVFASRDGGRTWGNGGEFSISYSIDALAVDPTNSSHLLAGTIAESPSGVRVGLGGIFWTENGRDWALSSNYVFSSKVAFDPVDPLIAYSTGYELFRSGDGGFSWTIVQPPTYGGDLAVDPFDPRFVYAGQVRSSDRGLTWTDLGGPAAISLVVGPGGVVYSGTESSGVWKSTDHGATFVPANAGIENTGIATLAVDSKTGALFASTRSWSTNLFSTPPGLFASIDGGATWRDFSAGLPDRSAWALAVDASSGTVYAGSANRGLFRRSEPGVFCRPSSTVLCLGGGRFRVETSWTTGSLPTSAQTLPLTADAGAFWFFSANNLELVVKVVDGTAVNGKFWVFGAALTDVEYDLAVTDTTTGAVWTRHNPGGTLASFADTAAF